MKSIIVLFIDGLPLTRKSDVLTTLSRMFPQLATHRLRCLHQEAPEMSNAGGDLIRQMFRSPDQALLLFHQLLHQKMERLTKVVDGPDIKDGDILVIEGSHYYLYHVLCKYLLNYIYYYFKHILF